MAWLSFALCVAIYKKPAWRISNSWIALGFKEATILDNSRFLRIRQRALKFLFKLVQRLLCLLLRLEIANKKNQTLEFIALEDKV